MFIDNQYDVIQNFIYRKIKESKIQPTFWAIKSELSQSLHIHLDNQTLLKRIKMVIKNELS